MKYTLYILIVILVLQPLNLAAESRGLQFMQIKTPEGEEIGLYKESHALLIGVSDYTAGWPSLPGVKKDVQAVQTVLEEHGFHVVVVEDPTRAELDQVFTDFINQYGQESDNRLLFYFSGHGHTLTLSYGDEMGYIVPVDAPNPHTDETGFMANAMDMQMIEVYAKRIQSKHALFLFDSCFSGSIFSLSRAAPESITYKTAKPVRQFMTSGSAEEQVPDESIFRQQFISALDGEADVNGDGYVTGTELGEFLQDNVVNYSKGAQHPQYGKISHPTLDKGDFVFLLPGTAQTEAVSAEKEQEAEPAMAEPATAQVADPETEMWELIKNSDNISDVQDFLAAFPDGKYAKVAQLKLKQLEREESQQEETDTSGERERAIVAQEVASEVEKALIETEKELREVEKKLKEEEPGIPPEPGVPPAPKAGNQMSPPEQGVDKELPPLHTVAILRVRDGLLILKDDLLRITEKRDTKRFEEEATSLTKIVIKDIDEALEILKSSPDHARAVDVLKKIRTSLPGRMKQFVRLAKAKKWRLLRIDLEKILQEAIQAIETKALETEPPNRPLQQPDKDRR